MNGKANKNRSGFSYSFALYKTGSDDIALSFGPFNSMKSVNNYCAIFDKLIDSGLLDGKYIMSMEKRNKV